MMKNYCAILMLLLIAYQVNALSTPKEPLIGGIDDLCVTVAESSDSLPSVRNCILYPGLYGNTVPLIGVGFLSSAATSSLSNISQYSAVLGWRDLYGWGEGKTGLGKTGIWVGHLDYTDHHDTAATDYRNSKLWRYGGSGAIWQFFDNAPLIKGVSISLCKESEISAQYNYEPKAGGGLTVKSFLINGTDSTRMAFVSLCKLTALDYLRIGWRSSWIDTTTTSWSHWNFLSGDSSVVEKQLRTNQIDVTIIRDRSCTFGVTLASTMHTMIDSSSQRFYSWQIGQIGATLSYTNGRDFHYENVHGHLGVELTGGIASAMYRYIDTGRGIPMNLGTVIDHADRTNLDYSGAMAVPVRIESDLFNSGIMLLGLITPAFNCETEMVGGRHGIFKNRRADLAVQTIGLGIKGHIGKQLDYLFIPSVKSDILTTGLELRYRF